MTHEGKRGDQDQPKDPRWEAGGFSGMQKLGRFMLEKKEHSTDDLRATRNVHRQRRRDETRKT